MPIIDVPGVGQVRFPDDMSDKDIINAIENDILKPPKKETGLKDYLKDIPKAIGRGAVGLGETAGIGAAAILPEEYEAQARKGIESLTKGAQQYLAPESQEIAESIPSKLASGLGSTLPFFAAAPFGVAGALGAAGLGVAAGAGEARQAAEQKGATTEERRVATALGAPTGFLDIIAPEIKPFKGLLTTAVARGGVEGLTEAAQKIAQNLIAKGVYDPKQEIMVGAGEEGAYGAGVGALASLIVDMTLGRRARGPQTDLGKEQPPAPPPPAPTQTPEQAQQAALGMQGFAGPAGVNADLLAASREAQAAEAQRREQEIQAQEQERLAYERELQAKADEINSTIFSPDPLQNELARRRALSDLGQPAPPVYTPPTPMTPEEIEAADVQSQLRQKKAIQAAESLSDFGKQQKSVAGRWSPEEAEAMGLPVVEKKKAPTYKAIEHPENKGFVIDGAGNPQLADITQGAQKFKTKAQAEELKSNLADYKVISMPGGGFALSPKTEAELAREGVSAKQMRSVGRKGPLAVHEMIAQEGGMSADAAKNANVSQQRVGSYYMVAGKGKGMTADQIRSRLESEGYVQPGEIDDNEALQMVAESMRKPRYTPEGQEQIAEQARQEEAAQAEKQQIAEGLQTPVAEEMGYKSFEVTQDQVDEALARAEDLGIDPEYIKETAYEETRDGTPQDFNRRVVDIANQFLGTQEGRPQLTDEEIEDLIVDNLSEGEIDELIQRTQKEFEQTGVARPTAIAEPRKKAGTVAEGEAEEGGATVRIPEPRKHNLELGRAVEDNDYARVTEQLSKSKNPLIANIGKLASKLVGVTTQINPEIIRRLAPKAAAGYSQKTGGIYVRNKQYAGNEHVIAHELTHALTLDAVQNPTKAQKPAVKRLDNLYRYVKTHLGQRGRRIYGLTNIEEFIAEGNTNPAFQKELAGIRYQNQTAWGAFTKAVADILGIKNQNALTELIALTEELTGTAVKTPIRSAEVESITPAMVDETPTTQLGRDAIELMDSVGFKSKEADPTLKDKIFDIKNQYKNDPEGVRKQAYKSLRRYFDGIETSVFSSDAALNNQIRRAVIESTAGQEVKLGTLLNTSLSQTAHSDAVAGIFLREGNIRYNEEIHKWEGVKDDNNALNLSKGLDKMAERAGLSKQQVELIAHKAFEARRTISLMQYNKDLEAKAAGLRYEAEMERRNGAPVKASALSAQASNILNKAKYIHMRPEEIQVGMKMFDLFPELKEVTDIWNGMRQNAMKVMVDTGLYSQEDAELLLDNAEYVPFYREEQIEAGQGPKEFLRSLSVQAEKRLKGSEKPVNDIFDNMIRWTQYAINRGVRNRSAVALAETAEAVGLANKVENEQDGKNLVSVWKDGKKVMYSMEDPLFMRAFQGIESVSIPTVKFFSKFADILRQSVVMYPLFSIAQVPQDSFAAMFSSGLKPPYALSIPFRAMAEFARTLRGTSKAHEELKNVGAVGVRDFTSAVIRADAEIAAGLKQEKGALAAIKRWMGNLAMAADNSVRQAVYTAAIDQGLTRAEAMEKSFEIFNVRRRGSSAGLALAGQVIPFFNAYLAAQNVAYRTLTGVGTSPTERKAAFQTLLATTGSVMALSMLYAMMMGDDDDYIKKPTPTRDRLLMIPGTGGLGLPLRADIFLLPKALAEHTYLLMTDNGFEDGYKFRESMKSILLNSIFSPTPVPQAIKPLAEIAMNHDFFQNKPLVGVYQQKKELGRQFEDSTSEFAKLLGQTNMISPIMADHFIRGMFGSYGGLFLYATNPVLSAMSDTPRPDMTWRDAVATVPNASAFVSKEYEPGLRKDFYALKEVTDRVANTVADLKQRSPYELADYLSDEEHRQRYALSKPVTQISNKLTEIRQKVNLISQLPEDKMNEEEKQAAIKRLRDQEDQLLKGINIKALRQRAGM